MLWPGHKYLGPGNDLDITDENLDSADLIAKAHDIAYEIAHSPEEVREADRAALKGFLEHTLGAESIPSFFANIAGLTGLSVKYITESITGVLYP